jgi:sigma-E factor negative regulatory protein RseB
MMHASWTRGLFSVFGSVLLLASGTPAWATAAEEAREWIDKMTRAVQTLTYDATFVYLHGTQLETMRIIHQADETGERERLISLNGTPREIIRNNDLVVCFLPDSNSVLVERSQPRRPFSAAVGLDTERLLDKYEFTVLGRDRMVGRAARVIAIQPRDEYRYGYRLWLAEDTGMLLKSDLVNEAGQAIEQVMLTSLEIVDRVPQGAFEPAVNSDDYVWYRADGGTSPQPLADTEKRWQLARLPAGFELKLHQLQAMPGSEEPVEHLMVSDGLASVSVFIEQADTEREVLTGTSYMGAVNAYGTHVAGHQVTVVGEVPQATVVLIGESIYYDTEVGSR